MCITVISCYGFQIGSKANIKHFMFIPFNRCFPCLTS